MKSLLKFTLLSALIISGRLAKQPAPAVMAKAETTEAAPTPDTSVVLVHHMVNSEQVRTARKQAQPQQSGSSLIANLF